MAKFTRSSKQIWDKAALAVDEAIGNNRSSHTIDHANAEQSYSLVIRDAEERLQITDQQALDELDHFSHEILGITKSNRYFVWIAQFIVLILALTLSMTSKR